MAFWNLGKKESLKRKNGLLNFIVKNPFLIAIARSHFLAKMLTFAPVL